MKEKEERRRDTNRWFKCWETVERESGIVDLKLLSETSNFHISTMLVKKVETIVPLRLLVPRVNSPGYPWPLQPTPYQKQALISFA